jgi:hypothetical protein
LALAAACYYAGGRCALALGADGKAHVAYFDSGAGRVIYAYEK